VQGPRAERRSQTDQQSTFVFGRCACRGCSADATDLQDAECPIHYESGDAKIDAPLCPGLREANEDLESRIVRAQSEILTKCSGKSLYFRTGKSCRLAVDQIEMSTSLQHKLGIHKHHPELMDKVAKACSASREHTAGSDDSIDGLQQRHTSFLSDVTRSITNLILHSDRRIGPSSNMSRIKIDSDYDFYIPLWRQATTKQIAKEVIHRREEVGYSSSEESDNSVQSESSCDSVGDKPRNCGKKPRRKSLLARDNHQVITEWGVVVAKVLHHHSQRFATPQKVGEDPAKGKRNRKSKAAANDVGTIDGRGAVLCSVRATARCVIDQAWELRKQVWKEDADRMHGEWSDDLLPLLFSSSFVDNLILLTKAVCKVSAAQPPLVEARVPCRVFGDLHGQLRDLLLLFRCFGGPDTKDAPSFVFNGDFVDRGAHQLEVAGLLFALKVLLPESVWLVRGNHEDVFMNKRYGFEEECNRKLGEHGPLVFSNFQKAFAQLPLACLIDNKILVVHGGIGDGRWRLSDLRAVQRPLDEEQLKKPSMSWIYDLMWSDPIEDDDKTKQGLFGVHESPRSSSRIKATRFAWDVTKTFCAANGLSLIIRSHQAKKGGLGFDIMHEEHLIRVFSARDYERNGNDGAVLLIRAFIDPETQTRFLKVRAQVLHSFSKAIAEAETGLPPNSMNYRFLRTASPGTPKKVN